MTTFLLLLNFLMRQESSGSDLSECGSVVGEVCLSLFFYNPYFWIWEFLCQSQRQFGMSLDDSMGKLLPTVDVSDHEIGSVHRYFSTFCSADIPVSLKQKKGCCRNMILSWYQLIFITSQNDVSNDLVTVFFHFWVGRVRILAFQSKETTEASSDSSNIFIGWVQPPRNHPAWNEDFRTWKFPPGWNLIVSCWDFGGEMAGNISPFKVALGPEDFPLPWVMWVPSMGYIWPNISKGDGEESFRPQQKKSTRKT